MQNALPTLAAPSTTLPEPQPGLLNGASLFLDFDGTLVEIAPRPDAVVVEPRAAALVARALAKLNGRVAIVSGRPVDELRRWLGPVPIVLAGSHGAELCWPDGRVSAPPPLDLEPLFAATRDLRTRRPGVVVEAKPFGFAIHYRGDPAAEAACGAVAASAAAAHGLIVQPGKMVFELRAPGADKGDAVRRLLAELPMAGTVPVFVGDDLTDEAGFAAAAEHGGAGILVGPERPSAARYRLRSVAATLDWLAEALA